MNDPLAGPRRKLARARLHFEDVRTILDDLRQNNMSYGAIDYNRNEGRYEFSLQDDWVLPPELPLIVGDAVHNARSSLDHLAWALASAPSRDTGFPIRDPARPVTFIEFTKRPQVQSMKASAIAKLERLQPYNRTDGINPLWWVNELDVADKHHLVLRTHHGTAGFGWPGDWLDNYDVQPARGDEVKRGTVFAYAIGPFDQKMQSVQMKPTIDVVIMHEPVRDYPLDWVLTTILDDIEQNVLPIFTKADFH
jgi:hypothetical protein